MPAWVSATGMPVCSASRRRVSWAPEYSTPPPAMISGRRALRMMPVARDTASGSGTDRAMGHTRVRNSRSGQS